MWYLDDVGQLAQTANGFHLFSEWSQVFDVATAVSLEYETKANWYWWNVHLRPTHYKSLQLLQQQQQQQQILLHSRYKSETKANWYRWNAHLWPTQGHTTSHFNYNSKTTITTDTTTTTLDAWAPNELIQMECASLIYTLQVTATTTTTTTTTTTLNKNNNNRYYNTQGTRVKTKRTDTDEMFISDLHRDTLQVTSTTTATTTTTTITTDTTTTTLEAWARNELIPMECASPI